MAYQIARLPMTLSEKSPPKVFGMGPPKSLIRPCSKAEHFVVGFPQKGSHDNWRPTWGIEGGKRLSVSRDTD